MRGYPKYVATKQDFINLLSMPQYREQAVSDLVAIRQMDDDKAMRVVSGSEETEDLVTEEIDNPMPLWEQKGFDSREEINELVNQYSE